MYVIIIICYIYNTNNTCAHLYMSGKIKLSRYVIYTNDGNCLCVAQLSNHDKINLNDGFIKKQIFTNLENK